MKIGIAVEMDTGEKRVFRMDMAESVKGPMPSHGQWQFDNGQWVRTVTEAAIEAEVLKAADGWFVAQDSNGTPREHVKRIDHIWRMTEDEDAAFTNHRAYRNALVRTDADVVEHDIDRAQELHRALLRKDRVPLLTALDNEWMIATRANDTEAIAEINAEKQVLLDAPALPEIAVAQSVEDLVPLTMSTC